MPPALALYWFDWHSVADMIVIPQMHTFAPVVDNDEQDTEEFIQPQKYVWVTIFAEIEALKTSILRIQCYPCSMHLVGCS